MFRSRVLPGLLLAFFLTLTGFSPPQVEPPRQQSVTSLVSLTVAAGFDTNFRDNAWLPVIVQVRNDGDAVSGRLVVRPETSRQGISNTYSVPVDLPNGARQTVFLYLTASAAATQIRVDLIDDQGNIIAAQSATLHSMQPQDRLYVVVSSSTVGSVALAGAHLGGYNGYQVNWRVQDLPDQVAALDAVDMIVFSDVDTGALSAAQKQAISGWLTSGGHLLVTGGPNWQATAAGVLNLLPLKPDGSVSADNLTPLADWLRQDPSAMQGQIVLATGQMQPASQVLVSSGALPVLVRGNVGAGTVDYLAADPNTGPLRGWSGLTDLWFTLLTDVGPQPSWSQGFTSWDRAGNAVQILPGFSLLPDALPLCGFLAAYIALIGPANYILLNKINRREYAWVTIPALIVVFSALAWVLGFNLRGNEATLNQLTVVRSWPTSDQARVEGLVGLLSPRRAQYSLTANAGSTLRPLPRGLQTAFLSSNPTASVDIQQTDVFQAADFPVDASFIAEFNTAGMVPKPAISGQASLVFEGAAGQQRLRGSVRNDSNETLTDPVILARGMTLRLNGSLKPGDVAPFDMTLSGGGPPAPAVSVGGADLGLRSRFYGYYSQPSTDQTVIDILGTDAYSPNAYLYSTGDSLEDQRDRQRQLFLSSFTNDAYSSTGRGERVYLAGWTNSAPLAVSLEGATSHSENTALYLVELAVDYPQPTDEVEISPDQFTWAVNERTGLDDIGPVNLQMQPGDEVVFQFTPLPHSVLHSVSRLTLAVSDVSAAIRTLPLQLWNWQDQKWEDIALNAGQYDVFQPQRYLGPQNAVKIHLVSDTTAGYLRIDQLAVAEWGRFGG